jgi:hypothetical protein
LIQNSADADSRNRVYYAMHMEYLKKDIKSIYMLLDRLERISADSYWAHRASGLRGSLLRAAENMENGNQIERQKLERLIVSSFKILEHAGKDLIGA